MQYSEDKVAEAVFQSYLGSIGYKTPHVSNGLSQPTHISTYPQESFPEPPIVGDKFEIPKGGYTKGYTEITSQREEEEFKVSDFWKMLAVVWSFVLVINVLGKIFGF